MVKLGLVGIISGVVTGAVALWISVAAAAGGHGTYLPAALLFPFTMGLAVLAGSITPPLVALAFAQYPLYGWLAIRKGTRKSTLRLLAIHVSAVALALVAVTGSDAF